jgi:hypothetical protein
MGSPKDINKKPVKIGMKFSKKANMWCVYKVFNTENHADEVKWIQNKEEAEQVIKDWKNG